METDNRIERLRKVLKQASNEYPVDVAGAAAFRAEKIEEALEIINEVDSSSPDKIKKVITCQSGYYEDSKGNKSHFYDESADWPREEENPLNGTPKDPSPELEEWTCPKCGRTMIAADKDIHPNFCPKDPSPEMKQHLKDQEKLREDERKRDEYFSGRQFKDPSPEKCTCSPDDTHRSDCPVHTPPCTCSNTTVAYSKKHDDDCALRVAQRERIQQLLTSQTTPDTWEKVPPKKTLPLKDHPQPKCECPRDKLTPVRGKKCKSHTKPSSRISELVGANDIQTTNDRKAADWLQAILDYLDEQEGK